MAPSLAFIIDVSERRANEKVLRSEERLRAVIENAVDGVVTIDEAGIMQSATNPAAEKVFGYSATELIGRNISMLMPEPDRSRHDSYLANDIRTGEAKIIGHGREVTGRRKDGSTFPMDLAVSAFHVGSVRYFTGLIRDITERKSRRRTSSIPRRCGRKMPSSRAATKNLDDFAYIASHDLKEPLADPQLFDIPHRGPPREARRGCEGEAEDRKRLTNA